jgi:hypothetical protein
LKFLLYADLIKFNSNKKIPPNPINM